MIRLSRRGGLREHLGLAPHTRSRRLRRVLLLFLGSLSFRVRGRPRPPQASLETLEFLCTVRPEPFPQLLLVFLQSRRASIAAVIRISMRSPVKTRRAGL